MEDLFNFQQRNHSMPDWREAYKILSVSGRPASRRAIDFSRAFWYRLLQDKVVWTCSTPITQAHRCRRYILLARMTKGAAVRENDKMVEHESVEMAEEQKRGKCAKKSNIFTKFYYFLFLWNSCSRFIFKITRGLMKFFSKKKIFIQLSKDTDILFSRKSFSNSNKFYYFIIKKRRKIKNIEKKILLSILKINE